MLNLLYLFILMFVISSIFLMLNFFFSKKKIFNREKNSPFECGFDPLINSRLPFSIHFFLISLIFLIFDIEITLLIPLILLFLYFNKYLIISCFLFLLILLFTLYLEYLENSIDWKI